MDGVLLEFDELLAVSRALYYVVYKYYFENNT